jgi:preprotein translocase subunit SecA
MTERQFPDAEERARIIARRNQLHRDLIEYMVTRSPNEQEAPEQLNPIVREHGFDEVYRMLQKINPRLNSSKNPDQDQRLLYAEYVELFRRFGGVRPFLTPPEYVRLNHERATLLAREILQELQLTQAEQHRLDELSDLLLAEPWLWDDQVPESPPKAMIASPAPQKVGRNEPCPCSSGRKYKHCHGR